MPTQPSIEEVRQDIATYRARLKNPGALTPQQISLYEQALEAAERTLNRLLKAQPQASAQQTPGSLPAVSHMANTDMPHDGVHVIARGSAQSAHEPKHTTDPTQQITTRRPGGAQPAMQPIDANICLAADHSPKNPKVEVTWSDGYTLTLDEVAACGRLKTLLRDLSNYKCIQNSRPHLIWKWDQSWRAVGVYRALVYFFDNEPPTLQQIGVKWPTDALLTVFGLIQSKAKENGIVL